MGLGQKIKEALDLNADTEEKIPGSYPSETDLNKGTQDSQKLGATGTASTAYTQQAGLVGAGAPGVIMPTSSTNTTERHVAEPSTGAIAGLKDSQHNKLHKKDDPRGFNHANEETLSSGPSTLAPQSSSTHGVRSTTGANIATDPTTQTHHDKAVHDSSTTHRGTTSSDDNRHSGSLLHRHDNRTTAAHHDETAPQQSSTLDQSAQRSHKPQDSGVDVGTLQSTTRKDPTANPDPSAGSSANPYWGDIQPGDSHHHHTVGGASAGAAGLGAGAGAGLALRHATGHHTEQPGQTTMPGQSSAVPGSQRDTSTNLSDPSRGTGLTDSGGIYNTVTGHGSSEDPNTRPHHGHESGVQDQPGAALSQRSHGTSLVADSTPGYDPKTTTVARGYDSNPTNTSYNPSSTAPLSSAHDSKMITTDRTERTDRDAPSSSHDYRNQATAAGIGAGAGLAASEASRHHHGHRDDEKTAKKASHSHEQHGHHKPQPTTTSTVNQPSSQSTTYRSLLDPTPAPQAATTGISSGRDNHSHLTSGTASGVGVDSSTNPRSGHDAARTAAMGAGAAGLAYGTGSSSHHDHRQLDPSHRSVAGTDALGSRSDQYNQPTAGTTNPGNVDHSRDATHHTDENHSRAALGAGAAGATGAGLGYYASHLRDNQHQHGTDPTQRSTVQTTSGAGAGSHSLNSDPQSQLASGTVSGDQQRSTATSQPGQYSSRTFPIGAAGAGAGLGAAAAATAHKRDHVTDPSSHSAATTTTAAPTAGHGAQGTSTVTSHTDHDTSRAAGLGATGAGTAGLGALAASSTQKHSQTGQTGHPASQSTTISGSGIGGPGGPSGASKDSHSDGYNHLASGTPSGVYVEDRHTSDRSTSHPPSSDAYTSTGNSGTLGQSSTLPSSAVHTSSGTDTTGTKDRSYTGPAAAATGAALGAGAAQRYASKDKSTAHEKDSNPASAANPSLGLGDQVQSRHVDSSTAPYNTQSSTTTTTTSSGPSSKELNRPDDHRYLTNTDARSAAAPAAAAAAWGGQSRDGSGIGNNKVMHKCTSCGADNDITSRIKEALSLSSSSSK